MSYILFLLTYAFEASLRKYLISSSIIIFIKYIFLINIKFKKYIFNYALILLCLILPLIIHALSKAPTASIFLAIYDLLGIFLSPILVLAILSNDKIKNYALSQRFLYFVVLAGSLHSLLTIVQAVSDPISFINIGVYGEYSNVNFGDGAVVNVTGILATPSPFLNISAILSIWYLRDCSNKNIFSKISYILEFIIFLSGIFNLTARTYFIFSLSPYFIIFIKSIIQTAIKLKVTKKIILFIAVFILSLILFINKVTNFETQSDNLSLGLRRYQSAFLLERITSYYSDLINLDNIPSIKEAPGIGTTVGANEKNNDEYLESIEGCKGVRREWDFNRLLCISGMYGYLLILFCRLIPAIYLFKIYFSCYKKNKYKSSSIGILIVSFLFLLQTQFQFNDVIAGVLCIAITSNTIYSIGEKEKKELSERK